MNILIISPGILPVPAVNGGAVENVPGHHLKHQGENHDAEDPLGALPGNPADGVDDFHRFFHTKILSLRKRVGA